MTKLKRIIDANLNRASEATRILEEIARFLLDDKDLSQTLKDFRHELSSIQEENYTEYLDARDTEGDVGVDIKNSTKRIDIESIFKANIKRLQQALRTMAEYSVDSPVNVQKFETLRYKSYTMEKIMWDKLKENYNKIKINEKKLYLVTNSDNFETEDEFLDAIASALSGGVDIVQLREKTMPAKKILSLGKKIKELCQQFNATFIINDRIDIAALLKADGVHLGQDDLDIKSAREILGENAIIGISTHAPEQAQKAEIEGADYIGVGPIFETPTKAGRIPVGLEYAKWVAQNIKTPAFAIGGIDEENCDKVLQTGIKKLAVVRAIINSKSPKTAAEKILKKINCEIL